MRVAHRRLWAVQQALKAARHLYLLHRTLTGSQRRLGDVQVREQYSVVVACGIYIAHIWVWQGQLRIRLVRKPALSQLRLVPAARYCSRGADTLINVQTSRTP